MGPGDDAAVLRDGSAWTLDTLIQGVHFDDRLRPEDVGFKAVAVSVSDLVAMGATPEHLILGLSLPRGDDRFFRGFCAGLHQALEQFGLALIGGDTTRSPVRVVTTVVGGPCPRPVTRSGARPGDGVYVTGELGWAGAGWSEADPEPRALQALRRPSPPIGAVAKLASQASAAMDLSDGLQTDLPRLCTASGVGAHIEAAAIPGHPDLRCRVGGGEDYQLLITAPRPPDLGVPVTRIGTITDGTAVELDVGWPEPLFDHFDAGVTP